MEQNKAKKSKKTLGLVALALGALLAVGATAGTTLAKYISSGEIESTQATVAKWGYTVTADGSKLFGKNYDGDGKITANTENDAVIVSGTTKDIVAPGAKGSVTLSINGSAQVNAILEISLEEFETIVLTDDDTLEYYPLIWSLGEEELNDNETKLDEATLGAAIVSAIEEEVDGGEVFTGDGAEEVVAEYEDGSVFIFLPANTTVTGLELEIGWEWIYDNTDTDETYDIYDTLLGFIANGATSLSDLSSNVVAWLEDNAEEAGYEDDEDVEEGGKTAAENFFAAIKENSEITISFGLKATVTQTLLTADEFAAEYED